VGPGVMGETMPEDETVIVLIVAVVLIVVS
jgi:hypothetical protein